MSIWPPLGSTLPPTRARLHGCGASTRCPAATACQLRAYGLAKAGRACPSQSAALAVVDLADDLAAELTLDQVHAGEIGVAAGRVGVADVERNVVVEVFRGRRRGRRLGLGRWGRSGLGGRPRVVTGPGRRRRGRRGMTGHRPG